jgi:hypothetical protein
MGLLSSHDGLDTWPAGWKEPLCSEMRGEKKIKEKWNR